MQTGPRNLITDVPGLLVGNASDAALRSGVTVLTAAAPFTAAVQVMGGAPGTTETDLLAPDKLVTQVDALVLSGGSAFGLAAADGVRQALRQQGRGFAVGSQTVPIVPGAILFDLLNGGDKTWTVNPYGTLGARALAAAATDFALGSAGAGTGATTATLKGGLGSASARVGAITIGALVAVNAVGSVTVGDSAQFWAAPFEIGAEFGGLGVCPDLAPVELPRLNVSPGEATTIAIIATDADLTQAQATRLATAAHDGLARAIVPSHSLVDGDLVFAAATGTQPLPDPLETPFQLGHVAALCLSRAVARAIYQATSAPGDVKPSWQSRFGSPP
ncbi:P1 family peptidase [Pseudoruegeria sp. SK021]|uniref:P1 family peptidase n=1 Tax=Pseudoruegeria sp. SK021 TaxID=1933035 RepID=UPI000A21F42D|nr:P1 family peptidase [Pseudoruegeria sp. SK021]OSP56186.1 peptidase T4 [Pseudoruegeria sp. SK021]